MKITTWIKASAADIIKEIERLSEERGRLLDELGGMAPDELSSAYGSHWTDLITEIRRRLPNAKIIGPTVEFMPDGSWDVTLQVKHGGDYRDLMDERDAFDSEWFIERMENYPRLYVAWRCAGEE